MGVGGAVSALTLLVLLLMIFIPRGPVEESRTQSAYEESVHVVADAAGTHLEPASSEES